MNILDLSIATVILEIKAKEDYRNFWIKCISEEFISEYKRKFPVTRPIQILAIEEIANKSAINFIANLINFFEKETNSQK